MFCVIQKVQRKNPDTDGFSKELLVEEEKITIDGKEFIEYNHWYSEERFERPILDAYKISIHHSFRDGGKVKKKQWSICTMGYYDFIYYCFEDFVIKSELDTKIEEMGIKRSKFYRMVYDKLNPLEEAIRAEYEQTEEYITHQEHQAILKAHRKAKKEFEELYGIDTYSRIYDVFGTLRNSALLEELVRTKGTADDIRNAREQERKANEEYRKRSEEEFFKRYNQGYGGSSSSYSTTSRSNYSEEEIKWLHEIYRMASKKFHPDVCGDDGSKMKFLTKLKDQWGL